jgi:hypothetical protein
MSYCYLSNASLNQKVGRTFYYNASLNRKVGQTFYYPVNSGVTRSI